MSYQVVQHSDTAIEPKQSSIGYGGVIIVVIIIIVIIIVVIYFFFSDDSTLLTSAAHTWIIVPNTSPTVTFTANGGDLLSNTAPGAVALTLTAPDNPIGQEFIIDNSRGGGNITISSSVSVINSIIYTGSPTLPGSVIVKGKVSSFIWESATIVLKIT